MILLMRRTVRVGESFSFSCIRCDKCCGTGPNVALTVYDVIRMSKLLDVDPKVFVRVYAKVIIADYVPFMTLAGDDLGRCVFMGVDREGKTYCKVYMARPLRCRIYPAIPISPSQETLVLDEKCPGLGTGGTGSVPVKLFRHYAWEVKSHYELLLKKVLDEGMEPLEALLCVLEKLREEAKTRSPQWCDLVWLESLGCT